MLMRPATNHAIEQAAARCGVVASAEEWEAARQAIIASVLGEPSGAMRLKVRADGSERWLVNLAGRAVLAVYDPERALIITVLPDGAVMARRPVPYTQTLRGRQRRERATAEEWS